MNTTTPMGMLQQPRPFFMIFFVELWERFGYYGVQGVLAVFFVKQLGFSQEQAFVTFGAFAALVYGLISIGGYVGDHLLGTKRTIVLGALVLAIGYFMTGMSLLKPDLIFIALGTIAVGNGLFKANPASLLSKCYPPKDPRLDGAFTLFYMSINIGSLIALSLAPVIADRFGYSVTYNLCGAGLIIALLVYIACRGMVKDIGSEPDFKPMSFSKLLYVLLGNMPESPEIFEQAMSNLPDAFSPQLLFLDADRNTLIRRYSDTRRLHPLSSKNLSLAGNRPHNKHTAR